MPTPIQDTDRASSQTVKAQLALRDLILTGELKPGDRISELSLVDRLGMLRTDVPRKRQCGVRELSERKTEELVVDVVRHQAWPAQRPSWKRI